MTTTAPHRQSVQGGTEHAGLGAGSGAKSGPGAGLAVSGVSLAALLFCLLPARRRRLPGLLVALLVMALMTNLGCSDGTFQTSGNLVGGTPLGTTFLTITSAATDGVNTVRHTDTFQVTVQ